MIRFVFFLLLSAITTLACNGSSPRAEIICYYNGDLEPTLLDPCKCTILIVSKVTIGQHLRIESSLDLSGVLDLREKNPDLKILISVGGRTTKPEIFSTILSTVEGLSNFTEGISDFLSDNQLDGIELDWRWPGAPGGVKSKDDVTTLIKALRLSLDAKTHTISRRSAENGTKFESSSSEVRTETNYTGHEIGSAESSTEIFPEVFYDFEDDTSQLRHGSDYLLLDEYTSEEAKKAAIEEADINKDKILNNDNAYETNEDAETKPKRGKIKFKDHFQTDDEEQLHLEAIRQGALDNENKKGGWRIATKRVIGPMDKIIRPLEKRIGNGKILILTLSPRPEFIVKGYDLKALARIVDMFSVPSDNLTYAYSEDQKKTSVTYHHSRLMGVSDIHNADSLLDLIVSMGVPLDRLFLGIPTYAAVFTLEDAEMNVPRSPTIGSPTWISYKEVCSYLNSGNWTVERDEDLTGTYAFLNHTWIAYDDPISLRIKSKYALLRGLSGISIHTMDDDDCLGSCSQGPYPLLTSVYEIFTQLARTPRKAVLRSLMRDLETSESTVRDSYVGSSTDLRISPFRIVRVVDKTGAIRAVRSHGDTRYECSRQGYYRDPDDCSLFYRCVKFNQYIDDYTVFEYTCPTGLVFDDRWEICAWPSAAPPCDGSSEIFPVPRMKNVCDQEGYFADPENCRWFYACRDYYGNGNFTLYEFRCPFGLAYDEENRICNWPWLVSSCSKREALINDRRGRGKAIESGSIFHQKADEKSGYKECINCENAEIKIAGDGIFLPEKGIIVSASYHEHAQKLKDYNYKNILQTATTFGKSFSHILNDNESENSNNKYSNDANIPNEEHDDRKYYSSLTSQDLKEKEISRQSHSGINSGSDSNRQDYTKSKTLNNHLKFESKNKILNQNSNSEEQHSLFVSREQAYSEYPHDDSNGPKAHKLQTGRGLDHSSRKLSDELIPKQTFRPHVIKSFSAETFRHNYKTPKSLLNPSVSSILSNIQFSNNRQFSKLHSNPESEHVDTDNSEPNSFSLKDYSNSELLVDNDSQEKNSKNQVGYTYSEPTKSKTAISHFQIPAITQNIKAKSSSKSLKQVISSPIRNGYTYPEPTVAFNSHDSLSSQLNTNYNNENYHEPDFLQSKDTRPLTNFHSSSGHLKHSITSTQKTGYIYPSPSKSFDPYSHSSDKIVDDKSGDHSQSQGIKTSKESSFIGSKSISPIESGYIYNSPSIAFNTFNSKVSENYKPNEDDLTSHSNLSDNIPKINSQSLLSRNSKNVQSSFTRTEYKYPTPSVIFNPVISKTSDEENKEETSYSGSKDLLNLSTKKQKINFSTIVSGSSDSSRSSSKRLDYRYPSLSESNEFNSRRSNEDKNDEVDGITKHSFQVAQNKQKSSHSDSSASFEKLELFPIRTGYNYPSPSIKFDPLISISNSEKSEANKDKIKFDKSADNSQSADKVIFTPQRFTSASLQPTHSSVIRNGYSYPSPSINFDPFTSINNNKKPESHEDYNRYDASREYSKPSGEKATVIPESSSATLQHSAHSSITRSGYNYPTPSINFDPSTSINTNKKTENYENKGKYDTSKDYPKLSGEKITIASESSSATLQHSAHPSTARTGYSYPSPSIKFDSFTSTISNKNPKVLNYNINDNPDVNSQSTSKEVSATYQDSPSASLQPSSHFSISKTRYNSHKPSVTFNPSDHQASNEENSDTFNINDNNQKHFELQTKEYKSSNFDRQKSINAAHNHFVVPSLTHSISNSRSVAHTSRKNLPNVQASKQFGTEYNYDTPAVAFNSFPAESADSIQEKKPATAAENKNIGYVYEEPAVKLSGSSHSLVKNLHFTDNIDHHNGASNRNRNNNRPITIYKNDQNNTKSSAESTVTNGYVYSEPEIPFNSFNHKSNADSINNSQKHKNIDRTYQIVTTHSDLSSSNRQSNFRLNNNPSNLEGLEDIHSGNSHFKIPMGKNHGAGTFIDKIDVIKSSSGHYTDNTNTQNKNILQNTQLTDMSNGKNTNSQSLQDNKRDMLSTGYSYSRSSESFTSHDVATKQPKKEDYNYQKPSVAFEHVSAKESLPNFHYTNDNSNNHRSQTGISRSSKALTDLKSVGRSGLNKHNSEENKHIDSFKGTNSKAEQDVSFSTNAQESNIKSQEQFPDSFSYNSEILSSKNNIKINPLDHFSLPGNNNVRARQNSPKTQEYRLEAEKSRENYQSSLKGQRNFRVSEISFNENNFEGDHSDTKGVNNLHYNTNQDTEKQYTNVKTEHSGRVLKESTNNKINVHEIYENIATKNHSLGNNLNYNTHSSEIPINSENYNQGNPAHSTGKSISGDTTKNGFILRKSKGPSLLTKFGSSTKFQRFGPGGFRDFHDDLGPEVCERAGLFRHPDSCDKFYECYWDRWLGKFTLHIFNCPVTIVYDSGITACNWPFNGPSCIEED